MYSPPVVPSGWSAAAGREGQGPCEERGLALQRWRGHDRRQKAMLRSVVLVDRQVFEVSELGLLDPVLLLLAQQRLVAVDRGEAVQLGQLLLFQLEDLRDVGEQPLPQGLGEGVPMRRELADDLEDLLPVEA